jgi:hypothetical protein
MNVYAKQLTENFKKLNIVSNWEEKYHIPSLLVTSGHQSSKCTVF